jgi:outer membrane biogenesis lipoprotein LolB
MHRLLALLALALLAGCTTTNINAPQPNLQSINLGQPSCVQDCHTTQTATQGEGSTSGAITNTTSSTSTRSPTIGGSQ